MTHKVLFIGGSLHRQVSDVSLPLPTFLGVINGLYFRTTDSVPPKDGTLYKMETPAPPIPGPPVRYVEV